MTQYRLHGFPLLALLVVLSAFSFPTDAIVGDSCNACFSRGTPSISVTTTTTALTDGTAGNVPLVYWYRLRLNGTSGEYFGGCFWDSDTASESDPMVSDRLNEVGAHSSAYMERVSTETGTPLCSEDPPRFGYLSTAATCLSCIQEDNYWCNWGGTNHGLCVESVAACDWVKRFVKGREFGPVATSNQDCSALAKSCHDCLSMDTSGADTHNGNMTGYWYSVGRDGKNANFLGGCFWATGLPKVSNRLNDAGADPKFKFDVAPIEAGTSLCPVDELHQGNVSKAQTCFSCIQEGNYWCNWGETEDSGFCVESVAACDWVKREFPRFPFGPVATSKEECCALGETLGGCTDGNLDTPPSQCIWCGRDDANIGVCVYTVDPEADGVCSGTPTGKSLHGLGVELRKIDRGSETFFHPKLNVDLSCADCLAASDDATGPVWCSASSADPDAMVAGGLCIKSGVCDFVPPPLWGLIVRTPATRDAQICCDSIYNCSSCMELEGACSWCTIGVGPYSISAHGVCRRRRVDSVGGNSVDSCDGLSIGEDVGGYGYSTIEVQNAQECNSQKLKHDVELESFHNHKTCDQCVEPHGIWCHIWARDGVDLGVLGTLGGVCVRVSGNPRGACRASVAHLFPGRVDINSEVSLVCPH